MFHTKVRAIAAGVLLASAAMGTSFAEAAEEATTAQVEELRQALKANDPDGINALEERLYPQEYGQLVAEVAALKSRGQLTERTLESASEPLGQKLLAEHRRAIAEAPDAKLQALAEAKVDLLKALQAADVNLCVQAAETGSAAMPPAAQMSDAVLTASRAFGAATMRALVAGMTHPTQHAELSSDDWQAVMERYVGSGGSPEWLEAVTSRSTPSALSLESCPLHSGVISVGG